MAPDRVTLSELIAGVESHEKTLTVFNASPDTVETLRRQFADRNVSVVAGETASDTPESFVVLADDGSFVTAAGVSDVVSEEATAGAGGADAGDDPYRPILDHLDETMFTSYDTNQMVASSREIEDRAWRLGEGALHAGFQRLSILDDQMDVYTRLASKDGLDVHAYAFPDREMLDHDTDLTIHLERSEEIERSWFVVYDGGGVDVNKCALLAEERADSQFYGFWTYDPDTVDWIVDYLETSYGLVEQ